MIFSRFRAGLVVLLCGSLVAQSWAATPQAPRPISPEVVGKFPLSIRSVPVHLEAGSLSGLPLSGAAPFAAEPWRNAASLTAGGLLPVAVSAEALNAQAEGDVSSTATDLPYAVESREAEPASRSPSQPLQPREWRRQPFSNILRGYLTGLFGFERSDLDFAFWRWLEDDDRETPTGSEDSSPHYSLLSPSRPAPEISILTMRQLLHDRPSMEIQDDIRDISVAAGFQRWLAEIVEGEGTQEDYRDNMLLAVDEGGHLQGFLLLQNGYQKGYIGSYGESVPDVFYVAYMASRREIRGTGVGKLLFLEACRRGLSQGETRMVLHVKPNSEAFPWYLRMGQRVPIIENTIDSSYVPGEVWIRLTFDLARINPPVLDEPTARTSAAAATPSLVDLPPPLARPRADEPARGPFFTRTTVAYLASYFTDEMWIEATAFAIPLFVAAFHRVSLPLFAGALSHPLFLLAAISTGAILMLALGGAAGGSIIERLGKDRTYKMTNLVGAALASVMWWAYRPEALAPLALLFGLDYFFIGVRRAAGMHVAPDQYGNELGLLNRFETLQARILEMVGIAGAPLIGLLCVSLGITHALLIFAGLRALGAAISLAMRLPPRISARGRPPQELLREDTTLRGAVLGFGALTAAMLLLYLLVMPAFAASIGGGAGILGWMFSSYSAGAFAGAAASDRIVQGMEKKFGGADNPAMESRFIASTRRWLAAASLSLATMGGFTLAVPVGGVFYWAYPAAATMGFFLTGAVVQLGALIKKRVPEDSRISFFSWVLTATMLAAAAGFVPAGLIFTYFPATAFKALGLIAVSSTFGLMPLIKSFGRSR